MLEEGEYNPEVWSAWSSNGSLGGMRLGPIPRSIAGAGGRGGRGGRGREEKAVVEEGTAGIAFVFFPFRFNGDTDVCINEVLVLLLVLLLSLLVSLLIL